MGTPMTLTRLFWTLELDEGSLCLRPSSDGTYYGMVMSVFPSVHPSESPSVSHSFPHFSPTCFDILSWNFACHFLLIYIRSSSSVVNFRPFLLELCPFSNLKYWNYTVFRSFLLHALTYWAQILHMTLFCCTTDQVRVLSISVHFCRSYPLLELRILEIHSFPHFSPICFVILSLNFAYDFILLYYRSSVSVVNFTGVMPLLELKILEIHSFPQFSPICFDILSRNFAYDFVLLYNRSTSSVVNLHQCLWELCPF